VIDSHAHTSGDPEVLMNYLISGVTAVCDLGSPLNSMGDSLEGQSRLAKPIARLKQSGPMITVPGGLPGVLFQRELSYEIETEAEAQAAVTDLVNRGASVIKIYLDPWFDGAYPVLNPELVQAVVQAAHAHGLIVRAHVNKIAMLETALAGGVDVLEHVPLPQPVSNRRERGLGEDDLSAYSQFLEHQYEPLVGLIPRIVEQGVIMVPTLSKLETSLRGSPFPEMIQGEVFRRAVETVRQFHQLGGRVALGTDTIAYWGDEPGMPLREMELLLEAGLSKMEVIEAATRSAAYVSGWGNQLGTLEPGKLADVIVVEGDPLVDLGAFHHVSAVLTNGEIVPQRD
jgi:imidazolonepropionase-like amidohydrolase